MPVEVMGLLLGHLSTEEPGTIVVTDVSFAGHPCGVSAWYCSAKNAHASSSFLAHALRCRLSLCLWKAQKRRC